MSDETYKTGDSDNIILRKILQNLTAGAFTGGIGPQGPAGVPGASGVSGAPGVDAPLATPTNLLTPALWLKADSIVGLTDGQAVTTWPDVSGNANHATQSVSAHRPVYKINQFGTLPGVYFSGAGGGNDKFMDLTALITQPAVENFCVIVVGNIVSDSVVLGLSSANRQFRVGLSGANTIDWYEGSTTVQSYLFRGAINTNRVMVWQRVGGTRMRFYEGARDRTVEGTFTTLQFDVDRIGETSSVFNQLAGTLAEVLIWKTDLPEGYFERLWTQYFIPRYGAATLPYAV
jgi:hypothetical protein